MANTMCVCGRVRFTRALSRFLAFNAIFQFSFAAEYGVPIEIQLWETGRSPLDQMVDVTNQFGLKVLAEHNFLNDNNIAFSPYGLTGIMIALFEGVDGESSYQIRRAMQMPWNVNVMRVGFRDIHRTLKTYFVPEEGFLAGLALNNENVTFSNSYKRILRFYGFDLDRDQIPVTQTPSTPNNSTSSDRSADSDIITTSTMKEFLSDSTESSTIDPQVQTTSSPVIENSGTGIDLRGPTTMVNTMTTLPPEEMPTSTVNNSKEIELTTEPSISTTTDIINDTEIMSNTGEDPVNVEVETITMPSQIMNEIRTTDMAISASQDTKTEAEPDIVSTTEFMVLNTSTDTNLETLQRKKRSIVDFIYTRPPYVDEYLIYKAYDVPSINTNYFRDGNMFLVNGIKHVEVTYMHYNTVLKYASLPHLEATALRLPLDSDRYYLLIVLPLRSGIAELGRLIARMARESDLRDVYGALRPRSVKAVLPSFTVKGHIILTTDLQKLGIRDVFEPRQRDFTPMTSQNGVYVRSIEQAVSVSIRKYQPDEKINNRYSSQRQEFVHFSATYPFLYFVMDSTINVALMAGKMADPLNNRIL